MKPLQDLLTEQAILANWLVLLERSRSRLVEEEEADVIEDYNETLALI